MLNRLFTVPAPGRTTSQPARAGRLRRAALACACFGAVMLTGCAQPWQHFQPGEDQSALITHLGAPRETYDLPNGNRRLMWPTQPMGETTTAADVDAAGKILSVRQVLQPNEFYRAEVGKWTRDDLALALRQGRTPSGRVLNPLDMPWTILADLDDADVGALHAYLQSLPSEKNPLPLPEAPSLFAGVAGVSKREFYKAPEGQAAPPSVDFGTGPAVPAPEPSAPPVDPPAPTQALPPTDQPPADQPPSDQPPTP